MIRLIHSNPLRTCDFRPWRGSDPLTPSGPSQVFNSYYKTSLLKRIERIKRIKRISKKGVNYGTT